MAKRSGKPKSEQIPPPVCKAILLCDAVLNDPFTAKATIVGIFDTFSVPKFPGRIRPFFCFLQLTSGIGKYDISVELRHVPGDKAIATAPVASVQFEDRASKAVLIIPVPPLILSEAGMYDFIVFADGQEIDRQQFLASSPEKKNETEQPEGPKE